MKTIKFTTLGFKNDEIKHCLNLLLDNNYRVFKSHFKPNRDITYFTYSKNDKVAYLQADYSGVAYSTIHKSCKDFGTGFGLLNDHIINTTLKDLDNGFIFAPHWASGNLSNIKKYESLKEYLNKEMFKDLTVELTK